jgi:hypothetical protein
MEAVEDTGRTLDSARIKETSRAISEGTLKTTPKATSRTTLRVDEEDTEETTRVAVTTTGVDMAASSVASVAEGGDGGGEGECQWTWRRPRGR